MTYHLKRYNVPLSWPVEKKKNKYITKPLPGSHRMETALPLVVLLRDMMHVTQTARETKRLLHDKQVLVNGQPVLDYHMPVGLFDSITFAAIQEYYILLFNEQGKLVPKKISKEQSQHQIVGIKNKTVIKKNKVQLNLFNGSNLIVPQGTYKVGDSLILQDKKVVKHLKMEKGATIYLIGGKYAGKTGKVEELKTFKSFEKDRIIFKEGNHTYETLKEYAFVIDKL